MPGMMDTILNLGLNDEIVRAQAGKGWDERFLHDCYRRLIAMYCDVVLGVSHAGFEAILADVRSAEAVESDAEISSDGLRQVIDRSLAYVEENDAAFPQDPMEQLWGAVAAVFKSWNVRRAREYRRLHGISEEAGTAVNVQTMVFGNRGADCATGVAFTRDPSTGEKVIYGEYLINAQGEDVVAGIRTPRPILDPDGGGLEADFPKAFAMLIEVCETLERERREMQDVEFTIEEGELYMLQTSAGGSRSRWSRRTSSTNAPHCTESTAPTSRRCWRRSSIRRSARRRSRPDNSWRAVLRRVPGRPRVGWP